MCVSVSVCLFVCQRADLEILDGSQNRMFVGTEVPERGLGQSPGREVGPPEAEAI